MSALRRNLLIAFFAALAVDVALLIWLFSPQAPSRAAARQQLDRAELQLVALRGQESQLRQLNQRVHVSRQQVQEIMAAGIPEQSEASSKLLTEFSRIAALAQVQISGAEFNPDKAPRQGLRRIAVDLQVSGGYGNVVRFLNQMERSPMFFLLTQVSVSGASGNAATASGSVKLDLQLEAYAQVDATSTAGIRPQRGRPSAGGVSPVPAPNL